MAGPSAALIDEYQRAVETVNPAENIGVILFVPHDPDGMYFSYWDLRKEKDLAKQLAAKGIDVTKFLDSETRLTRLMIKWSREKRDDTVLGTYVFLRWQNGKFLGSSTWSRLRQAKIFFK